MSIPKIQLGEQASLKLTSDDFCNLLPPWEEDSLRSYCDMIPHGCRGSTYEELFKHLNEKISSESDATNLDLLSRNLFIIFEKLPSDITNRENIQKAFAKTLSFDENSKSVDLLKSFCFKVNDSPGIRTKIYYKVFLMIESAIKEANTLEKLKSIKSCFWLVSDNMPPEIKTKTNFKNLIPYLLNHFDFNSLKVQLNHTKSSTEVLKIQQEMEKLRQTTANRNLKEEAEKCVLFANKKFLTQSFVESHSRGSEKGRSIYPILSIDGGGIRGIIPAKVLVEVEKITQEPISNLFSLIGGTSTGGILALGLTKPNQGRTAPEYTAQDLLNLYTNQHGEIFRPNPNYTKNTLGLKVSEKVQRALFQPKYLTPHLFQEKFQDCRLSSALTDVVITTNSLEAVVSKVSSLSLTVFSGFTSFGAGLLGYNPTSIWSHDSMPRIVHLYTKGGFKRLSYSLKDLSKPYHYRKIYSYPETLAQEAYRKYSITTERTDDFFMADVAKATSAAPTFFLPIKYRDKILMDGGILQNNPSIPCVLEALNRGVDSRNLFMLSLGTGVESIQAGRAALNPNLGSALTSLWFQTTQPHFEEDDTLSYMLSPGACYRLQNHFEDRAPDLDDTNPATIRMLQESADKHLEQNQDQLREVCRVLKPDCI